MDVFHARIAPMFDHRASERVDVFPNPDPEFVQLWDSPSGTIGRRLLLTYLRTPTGLREINHHVYLTEGPFELIETCELRRIFHYRDGGEPRPEKFLPSGRFLVHDPGRGLMMRSVFTTEFDWERHVPIGKPLGDRAVMRLQTAGSLWYLSTYQEAASGSSVLWVVEEFEGNTRKRIVEVAPAAPDTGPERGGR